MKHVFMEASEALIAFNVIKDVVGIGTLTEVNGDTTDVIFVADNFLMNQLCRDFDKLEIEYDVDKEMIKFGPKFNICKIHNDDFGYDEIVISSVSSYGLAKEPDYSVHESNLLRTIEQLRKMQCK